MLPGPGQELLSGRLGLWRYDNEGCRYLFLAGFWDWRDTCVGDRRVAEKNLFQAHRSGSYDQSGGPRTGSDQIRVIRPSVLVRVLK